MNETLHVQWLGALSIVFKAVRKGGWLSAEGCLAPDGDLCQRFPLLKQQPYLDFATDMIEQSLDGHDEVSVRRYAACAMDGLNANPTPDFKPSVVQTIWHVIDTFLDGMSPYSACEFGRVAIPYIERPTRNGLREWLEELNAPTPVTDIEELYPRAEQFIDSLREELDIDELLK